MKKLSNKGKALIALASMGMLFGGCPINFDRILGSTVDHLVFEFIEPFVGDLTGALTADEE